MSLLRSGRGRLRWGWRLLLFVALMAAGLLAAGGVLRLLPVAWSGGVGLTLMFGVWVVVSLAASWALMEKVEGVPLAALGLPVDALLAGDLVRGLLLGVFLIAVPVTGMAAAGWVGWTVAPEGFAAGPFLGSLAELGAFLLLAAFVEELLFRGYPFQVLAERVGMAGAVGVTSAVFALFHLGNPGLGTAVFEEPSAATILPLVNLGLAGLILGLAFWRTYSLWYVTGLHFGWNWAMGFLFDLPVSGLEPGTPGYALFDTPGYEAVVQGPALWTGGSFGPEGGLAVTLVSVTAVAWIARTDVLSRALRVRALGPLMDRSPGGGGDRARPGAAAAGPAGGPAEGPPGPGGGRGREREPAPVASGGGAPAGADGGGADEAGGGRPDEAEASRGTP